MMCFSAGASFAMAGILIGGGAFCLQKALDTDHRYLAMAAMPVAIGLQQFMEGMVWIGAGSNNAELMYASAFSYMFFVWIFWPSWSPFMVSMLETNESRKKLLSMLAGMGLALGILLYLPYFWHPEWLHVEVVRNSLCYETTLLPDSLIPRPVTYFIYLFLIGGAPLFSSHYYLRLFGWSMIVFVPITYFAFAYAYISILCFFAALATINLIFIIAGDKCQDVPAPLKLFRHKK